MGICNFVVDFSQPGKSLPFDADEALLDGRGQDSVESFGVGLERVYILIGSRLQVLNVAGADPQKLDSVES